jgi:flagellar hook-associated protein 1 FlgK
MVDENDNELPLYDGSYANQSGYLKLIGGNSSYKIAIDSMDSSQRYNLSTPEVATTTGRGFSHFLGLNNFFKDNELTPTGDTLRNSAVNLALEQRLIDNPNLMSTGRLVINNPSTDPAKPDYTYVLRAGDNKVIDELVALRSKVINFEAAGGMPASDTSFLGYASEMLGTLAANAQSAEDTAENSRILYEGFKGRSEAVSGVNLDEELANTVVLQNAYSATARIMTVVNKMYDDLLAAF